MAQTCQPFACATTVFASGAKYAALADVPGLRTRTFFAPFGPICSTPTLLSWAGVPGASKPSSCWNLTATALRAGDASVANAKPTATSARRRHPLLWLMSSSFSTLGPYGHLGIGSSAAACRLLAQVGPTVIGAGEAQPSRASAGAPDGDVLLKLRALRPHRPPTPRAALLPDRNRPAGCGAPAPPCQRHALRLAIRR